MSAINPASFVTPVAGLQLPSGLGPGAYNPEAESYPSRQQQKSGVVYPIIGTPGAQQGGFELVAYSLPFPHMYPQAFQPLELETHQSDQPAVDYRGGGQHLLGLHTRYATTPYQLTNIQHPAYVNPPDPSNGGARKSQTLGSDWNHAFQGLSLGS